MPLVVLLVLLGTCYAGRAKVMQISFSPRYLEDPLNHNKVVSPYLAMCITSIQFQQISYFIPKSYPTQRPCGNVRISGWLMH